MNYRFFLREKFDSKRSNVNVFVLVLKIKTQSLVELGCLFPVNCVNFSVEPF